MSQRRTALVICLLIVVLATMVAWRFLRPEPAIVVSRETTYITEPLGEDGLPDYVEYLRQRYREGVTPENNAAVLIWQAMGPSSLPIEFTNEFFAVLGIETPDIDGDYFEPVDEEFLAGGDPVVENNMHMTRERPWTERALPELAAHIEDNASSLNRFVQASERSGFFAPIVTYEGGSLFDVSRETTQQMRQPLRTLMMRATLRVGEGRYDEALDDINAAHRLARLLAREPDMVDYLVGIAVEGLALDARTALVGDPRTPASVLERSLRELRTLERFSQAADVVDGSDRLCMLDYMLSFRAQPDRIDIDSSIGKVLNGATRRSIDWNIVLRHFNDDCDRYVDAMRVGDRRGRVKALVQVDEEIADTPSGFEMATSALFSSRAHRSRLVSEIFSGVLLVAYGAVVDAEDRVNMQRDLVTIAAALAIHRAVHDEYSNTLDGLVPKLFEDIPDDIFTGRPLRYERRGEGYLLYSVGRDENDDGGTNHDESIVDGEWTDSAEGYARPGGDLVIRVPVPPLEVPRWGEDESDGEGDSAETSTGVGEADVP